MANKYQEKVKKKLVAYPGDGDENVLYVKKKMYLMSLLNNIVNRILHNVISINFTFVVWV